MADKDRHKIHISALKMRSLAMANQATHP